MKDFFDNFSNFIWVNKFYLKRALKITFLMFMVFYVVWNTSVKRKIYQKYYGTPHSMEMVISVKEMIKPIDEKIEKQKIKIAGYDIEITPIKFYSVTGRVVYVDRYNNWFGTYYRSSGSKYVKIYDAVVPLDLSIVHGKMADVENIKKIKFKHEYRYLNARWEDASVIFSAEEMNNNHIIPASFGVKKALEIVKKDDVVYVEGYLIDWQGFGEFKDLSMKTATNSGQMSKDKYGGMDTGLCRQLYLTKIAFAGFSFE